ARERVVERRAGAGCELVRCTLRRDDRDDGPRDPALGAQRDRLERAARARDLERSVAVVRDGEEVAGVGADRPTAGVRDLRATVAAADAISSATAPPGSAKIEARSGSTLSGTAKLVDVDKGLGVHVEVENAAPGLHGVHIHEKGDCNDPKAMSAGGHYNPN